MDLILIVGIALVVIVIILAIILIAIYNGLVTKQKRVNNAWAQIDVQLKRRADLIPNLIETVKGYAKFEKKVLTQVTEARTAIMGAKTPAESAKGETKISKACRKSLQQLKTRLLIQGSFIMIQ